MNTKQIKILLADDDPDIKNQMELWLNAAGYKVLCVSSQAEAEKVLEQEQIDVAVLDLMMENKDSGFILAYKIKKKSPETPVFIVTSAGKETGICFSDNTENPWIKADAILNKGIRPEQLTGLIKTALERI